MPAGHGINDRGGAGAKGSPKEILYSLASLDLDVVELAVMSQSLCVMSFKVYLSRLFCIQVNLLEHAYLRTTTLA